MYNEMKYVYAVYQERSFSRAAKKLFVSQPALSNMVRKAEKEIGVPIFDRSTIPLNVTKEGAYYIEQIEKILFIERNVKGYFQDIRELQTGTLTLGGSSFFCSFVLPDLIGRFRAKYPNISIDLQEGNVKDLRQGLADESLDLILETALRKETKSIVRYPYKKEHIILVVPAAFDLNKRLRQYRQSREDIISKRFLRKNTLPVPLDEFRDVPFIVLKSENDMYERSRKICQNSGFSMQIAMSVDQILTSMNIAANGIGAAFVRADIVQYLPEDSRLTYYKIGDPLAEREVSFIAKSGRYMSTVAREFMRMSGVKLT